MPRLDKLYEFVIINDMSNEIFSWQTCTIKKALEELDFVRGSFPNRQYKLFKEVTGDDH